MRADNNPFLSVVVPCSADDELLSELLTSLAAQTDDDFEAIVSCETSERCAQVQQLAGLYPSRVVERIDAVQISACDDVAELGLLLGCASGEYCAIVPEGDVLLANWVEVIKCEARVQPNKVVRALVHQQHWLAPQPSEGPIGAMALGGFLPLETAPYSALVAEGAKELLVAGYAFPLQALRQACAEEGESAVALGDCLKIACSSCGVRETDDIVAIHRRWGEACRDQSVDDYAMAKANELLREAVASGSWHAFSRVLDELFAKYQPAEVVSACYRQVWESGSVDLLGALRAVKALGSKGSEGCKTIALYHYRVGIGGAENVVVGLAGLLASCGFDVVLIHDGPEKAEMDLGEHVVQELVPSFEKSTCDNYIERACALEDVLRRHGVDLLIYNQWIGHTLPWDIMLAKALGVSVAVHVHGSMATPLRWGAEHIFALPMAYHLVDAVVCLSETEAEFWGQFNANVFVAANPSRYRCEDVELAGLRGHNILWIARLDPDKHPEEALLIHAEVLRSVPDAKLFMVGGGPDDYAEALMERARSLGIAESVAFCGPQDDPSAYYRDASVMLMTSSAEGYPLVIAESKAFGVPTVMYDLPSIAFCEDPRGLFAVPQKDAAAAAHAIVSLFENPDLLEAAGTAARADAERLESIDQSAFWRDVIIAAQEPSAAEGPSYNWRMKASLWKELFSSARKNAQERARLERRIAEIEQSTSWRVGCAVTAVPRLAKDGVNRLRAGRDAG
jgi:glycosyltransferase involved in cell wall biosynthesis